MANKWGNIGNSDRLYFVGLQNCCRWWLQPWNSKKLAPCARKTMTNLDSILKGRDITFPTKVCLVSYGFSSIHVRMWELIHKEGWVPKNWYLQTMVLQETPESPLDCKEIKPVNHKGKQPWIFIGRTDAEAEAPILWPPDLEELTHWERPWSRTNFPHATRCSQKKFFKEKKIMLV